MYVQYSMLKKEKRDTSKIKPGKPEKEKTQKYKKNKKRTRKNLIKWKKFF